MSTSYGYSKTLDVSFDEALSKVPEALKTEGFGVLTEIDVKQTLKKKLDVDFRRYTILGACNPPLAHTALQNDLFLGLLLPCNVVVYEDDSGKVAVSFINPKEMFKVVDNPDVQGIAEEVDAKMRRALDAI